MGFTFFMPAIAEIILVVASLLVLLAGAFSTRARPVLWSVLAVTAIAGALWAITDTYHAVAPAFQHMFIQDNLAVAFKLVIGPGSIAAILLAIPYFARLGESRFEYPVLILLATAGMFGMVSAQDFLSLYVSLELQSLALYVLATIRRDHRLNSEAGLKYFFLGALSSGVMLYGISLLYGYAGSTSYIALANSFNAVSVPAPAIIVGLVLVISGVAFKMAAVPFHMWAPDVYQGSSLPVMALFAMAPKAAAIAVLCRLVSGPFAPVFEQIQQVLIALSVLSLLVGAFAGLVQSNIKRLLAYSSIGHVGFILMALSAGGADGVQTALYYTAAYVIMSIGAFAVLLAVYGNRDGDENILALTGFARHQPVLAACFAVILFSMAGIPPMIGFFAKIYVFTAALDAGLVWLVVTGVILSVVSAYYYLRLVKIMYFDAAPAEDNTDANLLWLVLAVVSAVATILLLVFPQSLHDLVSWSVLTL